jgi:hypothetical protein
MSALACGSRTARADIVGVFAIAREEAGYELYDPVVGLARSEYAMPP